MKRFTVQEYHRLIEAGVLREGERVELREGWLVYRMTVNPPHAVIVTLVSDRLAALLPPGWSRRVQQPITLAASEPEPDTSVVRGNTIDYLTRHPTATEAGLLVEVSDSSLDEDRTEMGRMYARANIPIYWIVNIPEQQVEVYTDPTGECNDSVYRNRRDYHRDEEVPLVLGGVEIARIPVADLLP
jgi:Uma2 family endonuclease